MEQTNITNDINQPIETPTVDTIVPKPNNIYKYLFFITLIILFGVIVYFYTNTNNNNNQPLNNNIKTVVETIPTEIEEDKKNESKEELVDKKILTPYKAVSILDEAKQVTKLVLIDRNFNETVIDESKYLLEGLSFIKPNYDRFLFSPNNNFLYSENNLYEGGFSYLYDLIGKKRFELDFFPASTYGFTTDSKYFYACAEQNGLGSAAGVIVRDLTSSKDIFTTKEEGYVCAYDKELGELLISRFSIEDIARQKIVSQYKFSEKTGVLTKTK
jgi:hypothetical protein